MILHSDNHVTMSYIALSEQQVDVKKNFWTQFYFAEDSTSVYFFTDLALHITGSCTHSDYCNAYTCFEIYFFLFYMHLLYQVILLNLFNSLLSVYILT